MTAVLANPTTRTVSAGRDADGALHIRFMFAALCTGAPIPLGGGVPLDHPDLCGGCRASYEEMRPQ